MTMIWHHLLTRDVIEACETTVRYGWEVDAMLDAQGGELSRLHLAEVVSRAGSVHGLALPPTDGALRFVLRFHPVPRDRWAGGTLLTTTHGRLGYALGDGRVIESAGRALTIVQDPGDRYVAGHRIPGASHG